MHFATEGGRLEMVRLLLDASADMNSETTDSLTPLHLAAQEGYLEIARLLLDAGADKNSANVFAAAW